MAAAVPTSCGIHQEPTVLAIRSARRMPDGSVVVATECADHLEGQVGPDHGGNGLPEVAITGRPRTGRCTSTIAVSVPANVAEVVDGATSQVLTVEPPR